jgi:hypothetical protein
MLSELTLRGFRGEPESKEWILAERAITRQNTASFLTTITLVNAIMMVGKMVAGAVAGSSDASGNDSFKKCLSSLEDVLFPKDTEELEAKTKRVRAILEKEVSKGPFKVKAMQADTGKGKVRIRRK